METTGRPPFPARDRVREAAQQTRLVRSSPPPPKRRFKDRHGRGARGPLLHPVLPGWVTRQERFAAWVNQVVEALRAADSDVDRIEFGIEEIPPSSPAEWEPATVSLSRAFPRDRKRGLAPRVVLYRLPIERGMRGQNTQEVVVALLVERTAELLGVSPEDLLPE